MSDIKSILSGIAQGAPITTPKKPSYRPKSSSAEPRTTLYSSFYQRPTDLKNARESKPEIQPSTTYKKLFSSELRITNNPSLAKGQATMKLQQNRRKLKMQRYIKETPQGRPQLDQRHEEKIFADRRSYNYRAVVQRNSPLKEPMAQQSHLKDQISDGLNEKFDCAVKTPASTRRVQRIATDHSSIDASNAYRYRNASPTQPRPSDSRMSIQGRNSQSERSSRFSTRKSLSEKKTPIAIAQQQQDDDLKQQPNVPQQQRLNRIMDMIGDTKLNNILWNDPAVADILRQLKVYDEKELDRYLEENTEYFQNLFKSSPFGSFKLHYIKPKRTSYERDNFNNSYSGSAINTALNDLPYLTDEDYQSLAKLYRQGGRIEGCQTIQQSEFVPKQASTTKIVPPDSYQLQQPQITEQSTYHMNFPNRGDYDPRRIFKRPLEENVVTGAEQIYQTTYKDSFGKTLNPKGSRQDLFSMTYIKERNSPKKSFHTLHSPELLSSYQRDSSGRKQAIYNRPLPFKYATELEKPLPKQSLPAEAYITGKQQLSRTILQQQEASQKNRRKHIAPWKYRILTKLKALLEYKQFLNQKSTRR